MEQDNIPEAQQQTKKTSRWWLWLVLMIVIILGGVYYFFILREPKKDSSDQNAVSKADKQSETVEEDWQINTQIFDNDKTSTDTHKISDNLYRMYQMDQGAIYYAESSDCQTFAKAVATGITEGANQMISNPAVLQVAENDWIMIYEVAPKVDVGTKASSQPGVSNQRNLYLATSTDGKSFTKVGLAIDSSKEDGYFASVPDLVKMPDGKIRLYYVSQGNSVGSAISNDGGRTWTRESGFRLQDMAVDPDVSLQSENGTSKWVIYYSVLDPQRNGIYKATSSDGLSWQNNTLIFRPIKGKGSVVDPDVVEIAEDNYAMFIGQSENGGSTNGEAINLYRATLQKSIF